MPRDSFQELSKIFIHSHPQSGTVDSIAYYGPELPTSLGVAAGEKQVGFNGIRLLTPYISLLLGWLPSQGKSVQPSLYLTHS